MADHVIHGTGKPRFVLPTLDQFISFFDPPLTVTVSSATSTTIVLSGITEAQLNALDDVSGIKGLGVWTQNSSSEDTYGVVQSFVSSTQTLTVDSWSNGNPNAGEDVELKGRYIDLPYCQRLTESFTPDYIVKKMYDGRIVLIKRGFYYRASLNYARYMHKDEMEIIRYLYNKAMNGCGFYPRVDNKAILYTVDIDPESDISFYQLQNHQGHGGVVINITGIRRVDEIPFADPTTPVTEAIADDTDTYVTDDLGQFPTAD